MKLFNKVAIVGTGLIGGSLALAIKNKKLAKEVVGISRHKKNLLLADKRRAIDKGSRDLGIIKGADLVILATPVETIMRLAPSIAKITKKDCIISDVGSTKEEIVQRLEKIFPNYVGSHPLAGSEKRSIKNADPSLFKDSLCILTPTKRTKNLAMGKLGRLWNAVGAKTVFLEPQKHDRILSFVSHLPHVVAFALIETMPEEFLGFASSGLKDSTRIASSDSSIWTGIFLSNRGNILNSIRLYQRSLARLKSAIQKKDRRLISLILEKAKKKRDTLA